MTALLRSRGATSEMARWFGAVADPGLDWRPSSWTGDPVPVVLADEGRRRLTTCIWGLSQESFVEPIAPKLRGTLYPRDLCRTASRLRDPGGLQRCLILIESFAYPGGLDGHCTRNWFGLWDEALAAWAGICAPDGRVAGLLGRANERVGPYSDRMPLLLAPANRDVWLAGAGFLALRAGYDAEDFYRENLGERWSTGRLDLETPPPFASAA